MKLFFKKGTRSKTAVTIITIFILVASIWEMTPLALLLGNTFFGGVPKLYNLRLAQFFFQQAAYPSFGKPVRSAHYQLGRTYFIGGSLSPAVDEFQKELELYPTTHRAYYMLGLTYGYMNVEEKAIENFSYFIATKPESWAARNDKAWLQFRVGDIDAALLTMEPIVHEIENPWVQNTYGVLLMNKKKYREAALAFDYAKKAADSMTPTEWGKAYPGNDPRVYPQGLAAIKISIENNLAILTGKQ